MSAKQFFQSGVFLAFFIGLMKTGVSADTHSQQGMLGGEWRLNSISCEEGAKSWFEFYPSTLIFNGTDPSGVGLSHFTYTGDNEESWKVCPTGFGVHMALDVKNPLMARVAYMNYLDAPPLLQTSCSQERRIEEITTHRLYDLASGNVPNRTGVQFSRDGNRVIFSDLPTLYGFSPIVCQNGSRPDTEYIRIKYFNSV